MHEQESAGSFTKKWRGGWRYSSVAELFPRMHEALCSGLHYRENFVTDTEIQFQFMPNCFDPRPVT